MFNRLVDVHITTAVQGLDWVALANRSIPAPFKPQIKNEMDVSNFSEDFTNMDVTYSPAVVPLDGTKIFKVLYLVFYKLLTAVCLSDGKIFTGIYMTSAGMAENLVHMLLLPKQLWSVQKGLSPFVGNFFEVLSPEDF